MNRLFAVLARYRPVLNRVMYALALLGVLNSVHLAVQASIGFEQGCIGSVTPEFLSGITDCGAVVTSDASVLLGVSNTVWGLLFYAAVAVGSFALLFLSRRWSALVRAVRGLLILLAFVYTVYLVYYQFFEIREICALCMVSAALITGLLIVQMIALFHRPTFSFARPSSSYKRRQEARRFLALAAVIGLLAAADVIYFEYYAEPADPWEELLEEEFGYVNYVHSAKKVQLLLE